MNSQIKTEILDISARNNFWKPYQFFFRYFQLCQYEKYTHELVEPYLELGSGDGIFTNMMFELGLVSGSVISTDVNIRNLNKGKEIRNGTYLNLDAAHLPLKDESVNTVYSNGVLCCLFSKLHSDIERVIIESYRVLKEGGIFINSVATNYFNENLSVFKLLNKLGLNSIANKYIEKFENRLSHHNVFKEEEWIGMIKDRGFTIKNIGYYFTPWQGYWYGIMTLKLFNVISVIKLIKLRFIKNLCATILKYLFRKIYTDAVNDDFSKERAGYILIIAQKN